METILATAFGHKVEILRGEAGGDALTTATAELFASISLAGPTGLNVMVALMCKFLKSVYWCYFNPVICFISSDSYIPIPFAGKDGTKKSYFQPFWNSDTHSQISSTSSETDGLFC